MGLQFQVLQFSLCNLYTRVKWIFSGLHEQLNGSVKEPNKFHNYETEKITRKASDMAEYIELFGSFTRDRQAWRI